MNGTVRRRKCLALSTGAVLFLLGPSLGASRVAANCPSDSVPQKAAPMREPPIRARLQLTVTDENGAAVPAARVTLQPTGGGTAIQGASDRSGRVEFSGLTTGAYSLRVEKEGFFVFTLTEVRVEQATHLEVTLNRQQEYKESVRVVASPQAIDTTETAAQETLRAPEIINLPYPTTRDIRNALPLLPGVLPDQQGQIHLNGSTSNQVLYTLDGFDISQPVSGLNVLRVSTDAVRSIEVRGSRLSASEGRGSAGLLNLETSMGDDHFRFYATDFIPSFQHGLQFQNVTPRFAFSGPLARGKSWFYEAVEGEYDENLMTELPRGADMDYIGRLSNLARVQVNLAPGNRLLGSYVANQYREDHAGLSIVQPLSTTTRQKQTATLVTLKDQASWSSGILLETGFAFSDFDSRATPLGNLPYVVSPGSASGNFYARSDSTARRYEGLANIFFPEFHWGGRHQFLLGTDLEGVTYENSSTRQPFTILRADGTRERTVSFSGSPSFGKNRFDAAGYVQDRWQPASRVLVEAGARLEEDSILRRALFAPRLAATLALARDNLTKLSAGIGIFYDRTDLDLFTRPLAGQRQDTFYAADGVTPLAPPVTTSFQANSSALHEPRFLNWSVGLERKLPGGIYASVEFVEKRQRQGFDYEAPNLVIGADGVPSTGLFVLENSRRDRYDAATLTLRHTFRDSYPLSIAYTRSRARSNALLDSTLDNPLFSVQRSGPLPWDSPNRIVSWGWLPFWLPLLKRLNFAYTLDWHSGYAFSLVNQEQELVGLPDRSRFPDYFLLDVHLEKKFHLFGFQWAIRGGFNDVTARKNPSVVNNNVDSPLFLAFGGFQHRAFTGRIRFLGRK